MGLYSSIIRKVILPQLLKRDNRGSAIEHWQFFDQSQYWPRQKLLDYQWQRIKMLLKHAYETTGYYRKIFDERGLSPDSFTSFEDVTRLPILTRSDLFDHRTELISDKFDINNLQEALTGGTTGQQASIYRNQESFNLKLAMAWRHEGWMGRKPCDRMAYIWPAHIDFHAGETLKSKLKDRYLLGETVYYAGLNDEKVFEKYYRDMIKFRPEYMKIFPSCTVPFTQYILNSNFEPLRLRGIMSTGEPLYENDRKLFQSAYGCSVYDMYGSREVGNTSCECSAHEGLHIAMETSYLEFVSQGKSVEQGEEGEILITDLTNYAFPMIRYQINDFGIFLKQSCSCGRELPLMSPGIGRLQDYIYTPDGVRHSGQMLGYHISAAPDVKIGQIQIVQKTLTDFLVRITKKPEPTTKVFDFIKSQMRKLIGEAININIEIVDKIPREKSGKTRFVICEIQDSEKKAGA